MGVVIWYTSYMDSLVHSDIFFFTMTVVIVVLGIVLCAIFLYILGIVRDVKKVSKMVEKEGDSFIKDTYSLLGKLVRALLKGIIVSGMVKNLFIKKGKKNSTRKK